jgi:hypothetical protein
MSEARKTQIGGALVSSWPHVTAKDCQYTLSDLGAVDARCEGCKHKVPNSPETKPNKR